MVSGKNSKAVRNARTTLVTRRSTPWGLIVGVLVLALFAGGIATFYVAANNRVAALNAFDPTEQNQDPSRQIEGVVVETYQAGQHVRANVQVAYTHSPPFGGAHDDAWATCTGVVYPQPVRTENLVHSLEHGAVWVAYNPDQVTGAALQTLQDKVDGQQYLVMSPYPGLDQPISLQAWGHQLKLADPADPRVDQFIRSLRRNPYTFPEPRATCNEINPGLFTRDSPPPFRLTPPTSAIDNTTIVPEINPSAPPS